MSDYTIGGGAGSVSGITTIPASLVFSGSSTVTANYNSMMQAYLGSVGQSLGSGTAGFLNENLAGANSGSVTGSGSNFVAEYTNIDPTTGLSVTGSGSYNATVPSGTTDVIVTAPGFTTLLGSSSVVNFTAGDGSNVNYTVTDPTAGTINLLGGANSITLYSTGTSNDETITSAGNDTINMVGQGTDYVTVLGNGVLKDQNANAYVTAEGNATTNLYWDSANSGGTLHFTNNSSAAAYIHIGVFFDSTGAAVQAPTHVTASGGAGGGYYVGGTAGNNVLIGGSGVVTLVGGGSGDLLEANASTGTNYLVAGQGNETLIASSTTGSNVFGAGLNYPGLGQPPATGVISTAGSGNQQFLLGNVPGGETIYGSTASTATNAYLIVSNATAGGGLYSIYNFIDSRSTIYLSNGSGGAGSASITAMGQDQFISSQYDIDLSDGTVIHLKGLTSSQISAIHTVNAFGITGISG